MVQTGAAVGWEEEGVAAPHRCPPASEPELSTSAEREGSESRWAMGRCPSMQPGHRLGLYLDQEFGKCSLDLPARANRCLSGKECAHF